MGQLWPNMASISVGALFFLRFLSPALLYPERFGFGPPSCCRIICSHALTEPPSPAARRGLVLISKLLQNVANGVEFGAKESCMCCRRELCRA